MGIFIAFAIAALVWAVWKGKLRTAQLPPVLIGLAGAFLAARGNFIIGIAAMGIGLVWYRGMSLRISNAKPGQLTKGEAEAAELDKARFILGVSRFDNADYIKERHRTLIAKNHPDTGGSEIRARELNEARDLLLRQLETKTR